MFFHVLDLQKAAHKLQGRCVFQGLQISIENRRGSVRSGVDKDGHKWSTRMRNSYGYVRGVKKEGSDGDKLDCFLGTHPDSERVFILHLNRADNGKFDEDKVYLGFNDKDEVEESFKLHYDKAGQVLFGGITEMDLSTFKKRLNVQSRGMIKSQAGSDLRKAVLEIDGKKVITTRLEDLEELLAHLAPGPLRDKVKADYDRLCGKTEKSFLYIIDLEKVPLSGPNRSDLRTEKTFHIIDLAKAYIQPHMSHSRAGGLEYVSGFDRTQNFPAAATLTEDSPVCGQKLGNFLEDVLSGANVSSFLQRATSELGVQQFEDWFNPAKIGARIYKRLRDDGKSHSVARKTAADAIRAYSAAFKSAIGLVVPVAA